MNTPTRYCRRFRRAQAGAWWLALGLAFSVGARAAVLQYTFSTTHQDPAYNWGVQSVTQFDSKLGTLAQVSIGMTAYLSGTIGLENTFGTSNQVTGSLLSTLTLTQGANTLIARPVSASASELFPGYDGVTDYGGTSGATYANTQGSASATYTTSLPADLAVYTDTNGAPLGTVDLGLSAAADTFQVTSGTGKSAAGTFAGVTAWSTVTVSYTYIPNYFPVPEPSGLLLAGLAAASGFARRRRRWTAGPSPRLNLLAAA